MIQNKITASFLHDLFHHHSLVEVLAERRDLFIEIVREVLEDYGFGEAIKEGLNNDPVSREEVFKVFSKQS